MLMFCFMPYTSEYRILLVLLILVDRQVIAIYVPRKYCINVFSINTSKEGRNKSNLQVLGSSGVVIHTFSY